MATRDSRPPVTIATLDEREVEHIYQHGFRDGEKASYDRAARLLAAAPTPLVG